MRTFQSTRPMRGATLCGRLPIHSILISIHAPHAGRDTRKWRRTSSLQHFNPRAPCGARRAELWTCYRGGKISIHAPHAGRDLRGVMLQASKGVFQSTRPMRGATRKHPHGPCGVCISIHAPHAGRDHSGGKIRRKNTIFQSTRPMRGATAKVNKLLCTFLQKRHGFQIFLRKTLPFKAFCRLQIGKNFSICGANRCGNFCELLLRTIRSSVLPEGRSACSQNAQFYSHTFSRDNRNADCLFPDP